jgi:hypothetical protein
MMNANKIKTLLLGMASINRMLIEETAGDDYWNAITDEFNTYLSFAGTELQALYAQDADTEEFEALIVENFEDTREIPAVVFHQEKAS